MEIDNPLPTYTCVRTHKYIYIHVYNEFVKIIHINGSKVVSVLLCVSAPGPNHFSTISLTFL